MKFSGKAFKYGDNIDTDVIIPARYLSSSDAQSLASYCMADLDASFSHSVKNGDMIVAGKNFGCGSSREHAPMAIKASGISCVIATSFARIFYRNAINIGLPILEAPEAALNIQSSDQVEIDLATGLITNLTRNEHYQASPFPPFIQNIIVNNGLINTLSHKTIKKITVLSGDGIGPEITSQAIKVLNALEKKIGIRFQINEQLIGGSAIDVTGQALPEATLDACLKSDAILLGAVGGPKWNDLPFNERPEKALLKLRKSLNLYANLRPAKIFESLSDACPLKPEIVAGGVDICVIRELTGGIYFGERGTRPSKSSTSEHYDKEAYDVEAYSESEIKRIGIVAFETAMKRKKHLISVDKANVLESSKLWRETMNALSCQYPEVTLEHLYVDNAAMQLIKNPKGMDVVVTSNLFGDILSDEASMITGSIGLLPSASIGNGTIGLYEPIHGSAPDIAGKNIANPIGVILSAALLLRYSLGEEKAASAIENAVSKVLSAGYRTLDIYTEGTICVGTNEMGTLIADALS